MGRKRKSSADQNTAVNAVDFFTPSDAFAGSNLLASMPQNELPVGWQGLSLGELIHEVDVKKRDLPKEEASILEVLSLTKSKGLVLQSERFGKRIAAEDTSNYKVVTEGQIVYNPYVIWEGAVHALRRYSAGLVSPVYHVWETNSPDCGYVDYLLRTPPLIDAYNRVCSGAVNRRRSIRPEVFRAIQVVVPPLSERRAIATVLRIAERAIDANEQVAAATRQLEQSLLNYLFTYGPVPFDHADRVQLKETETGFVPEHWTRASLGELVYVKGGKRLPKGHAFSDSATPHPYIRIVDFLHSTVNPMNLRYLTNEDYRVLARYTIQKDDIYISIAGSIGLVGTIPSSLDGANLTENAAKLVIIDKKRVDRDYLVDYLSSARGQSEIQSRTVQTSQPKLSLSRIRSIPIYLPSMSEQKVMASTLLAVRNKLPADENRRDVLANLFQSLIHHLMTGKVRVTA